MPLIDAPLDSSAYALFLFAAVLTTLLVSRLALRRRRKEDRMPPIDVALQQDPPSLAVSTSSAIPPMSPASRPAAVVFPRPIQRSPTTVSETSSDARPAEAAAVPASLGGILRRFGSSATSSILGGRRTPQPLSVSNSSSREPCSRYYECPMCYQSLSAHWSSLCVSKEGRPTCKHIYHSSCIQLLKEPCCIVCKKSFVFRRSIPSLLENHSKWFAVADFDDVKSVARKDLFLILMAQLPLDGKRLDLFLCENWSSWDQNGDDRLSMDEIFHPKRGLLAALQKHREHLRCDVDDHHRPLRVVVPDIRWDASKWFDFFDEDGSRFLSREEIVRGLTKSFDATGDVALVTIIRSVLEAVFPIFDLDGSQGIDRQEFLKPKEGLADSIIASLGASAPKAKGLAAKRSSSAPPSPAPPSPALPVSATVMNFPSPVVLASPLGTEKTKAD